MEYNYEFWQIWKNSKCIIDWCNAACRLFGKRSNCYENSDTNITEGAVNFFANYGMGTEDVDTAVDNLKQEYLLKEVAKAMDITLTDDEAKQVKSTISNFKAQQGGKKAGDKLLKSTVLMMI